MAAKKKAVKAKQKKAVKTTVAPKSTPRKTAAKKPVDTSNIGKSQLAHLRAIAGQSISAMGTLLRAIGPEAGPSTKWGKYESGEEKIPQVTLAHLLDYLAKDGSAVPVFRGGKVSALVSSKTVTSYKELEGGDVKVTCNFTPKAKRGTEAKAQRTTFTIAADPLNAAAIKLVKEACVNN